MPCGSGATYRLLVDWDDDGGLTADTQIVEANEDVTADALGRDAVAVSYGRDTHRALSPAKAGEAAFALCNALRVYSPDNVLSPLFGQVAPGKTVVIDADLSGTVYPLFVGRIGEDLKINADRDDRSVQVEALDGLGDMARDHISTALHASLRTGDAINLILDEIGWPADRRRVDPGATTIPWWWEEDTNTLDAIVKLVQSEGPPAIAYVAPDGYFVFRDRHHRLLSTESSTSQATFAAQAAACDAEPVTGFSFTRPFGLDHGLRDVINAASFTVEQRVPTPAPIDVWTSEDGVIAVADGQTVPVFVHSDAPFFGAIPPVLAVDYTMDIGTAVVTLTATSGQSTVIHVKATGGAAVVRGLKLRAYSLPVARSVKVTYEDPVSIAAHGRRSYPDPAPWAGVHDAQAIAEIVIGYWGQPRRKVALRVVSQDVAHLTQILARTVSDRITIQHDEVGINADFHIESVAHSVVRLGKVHAVVFGCEEVREQAANVFRFDVAGAGFNDGLFAFAGLNDPADMFIFDVAGQGFNDGMFAH